MCTCVYTDTHTHTHSLTHVQRSLFISAAIQMPVDVKAINSKAGSITVQWKKPNKVDTVYIDHFTVDYCLKEDCTDQSKTANI